jgi:hypothetical protein
MAQETSEREQTAMDSFEKNSAYALPGVSYVTKLSDSEEKSFNQWVESNKIPFDPKESFQDYDMRGYYKELQEGGAGAVFDPERMHFTDKYKTPFHESFSNESKYADQKTAPFWKEIEGGGNQLMTPSGKILFSEDAEGNPIKLNAK